MFYQCILRVSPYGLEWICRKIVVLHDELMPQMFSLALENKLYMISFGEDGEMLTRSVFVDSKSGKYVCLFLFGQGGLEYCWWNPLQLLYHTPLVQLLPR